MRKLALTTITILLALGMTATGLAESQETNVDLEVDDTVQLDVKPDQLDYTAGGDFENEALTPGEQRETSDRGFNHIDISNIGSDRLDNIFVQTGIHNEDPFGTTAGSDSDHNTGNSILLSTETAYEDDGGEANYRIAEDGGLAEVNDPHYLSRVEYFEDEHPEYIGEPTDNSDLDYTIDTGQGESEVRDGDLDNVEVGRFRVGEASYFFAFVEDAAEDPVLVVGNQPETPDTLGTFDLTGSNEEELTVIGLDDDDDVGTDVWHEDSSSFSLVRFDVEDSEYPDDGAELLDGDGGVNSAVVDDLADETTEEREYNLFVDNSVDEGSVARTKFDVEFGFPSGEDTGTRVDTGAQEYLVNAGTGSEALQPGESFPVDFGVQLPNGIDHDSVEPSTVTFSAEAR